MSGRRGPPARMPAGERDLRGEPNQPDHRRAILAANEVAMWANRVARPCRVAFGCSWTYGQRRASAVSRVAPAPAVPMDFGADSKQRRMGSHLRAAVSQWDARLYCSSRRQAKRSWSV